MPTRAIDSPFRNLDRRRRFVLLTTFRASGEAVATPMWFARGPGRLFMVTDRKAGKLRRIQRDPHVTVAPCRSQGRPLGPAIDGVVGSNAPITDQRGQTRPVGGGYDIGAVERQPADSDLAPWLYLPILRR